MKRILHIGLILALGALAALGAVPMPTNYVSVQQFITNHSDFRLTTNNGGVAIYWSPGRLTNFIGTVDQYLRGDITWQTFSNAVHSASTNVYEPVILAGTIYQYYRGDETWQIFGWTNLLYKPATLVTGTGVVSRITKWDSTGTNLVDSAVVETNGAVYFTDYDSGKLLITGAGGLIDTTLSDTDHYMRGDASWALFTNAVYSAVPGGDGTVIKTNGILISVVDPGWTTNAEPVILPGTTSDYWRGDKTWVRFSWTNLLDKVSTLVTGTGIVSRLTKWDSTGTNIVDSAVVETNGIVYFTDYETGKVLATTAGGEIVGLTGTTNYVPIWVGTGLTNSAIMSSNGVIYFTDYDTGKVLTTTAGGEISGISDTTNTHLSGGLTWVNTTNFFNYHLDNWWVNQNHTWTATNTFTGVLMITNNSSVGTTNGLQFTLSANESHSGIYEISQGLRIYVQAETNGQYRTLYFDLVNSNATTTITPIYLKYNQVYVSTPALFNVSSWHGSGRGKYALWDAVGYLTNSLNINYTDITNSPLFITGTGTVSRLSKWDSTGTNLVDSAILETNGIVYFTDYDTDKFLLTTTGGEITGHTLTTNSIPGLTNQIISLYSHTTNTSNPHSVTYTQVGASPENHTLEYHPNVTFGTIDEDNIIQRKGANWTNQPISVLTNGFVQGIGTLNRVSKFTGTNIIGDSAIIESNGVVYFTDYTTDKILQTTTGGELFGRNIEWPIASITNLPDYALVSQLITVGTSNYWNAIGDTVSNTSNSWNTAYSHSQITDGSNPHNTAIPGTNGFVQGIGTINYVSKFTATNAVGNSQVVDDGTNVSIGAIATGARLYVTQPLDDTWATIIYGSQASGKSYGLKVIAGTTVGDVPFQAVDQTGATNYMYLKGDGSLGIGTSSPGGMFEVFKTGTGRTRGSLLVDEANSYVYIGRVSSTGSDSSGLIVRDRTDTIRIKMDKDDGTVSINPVSGAIVLGTGTGIATLTSGTLGVRNVEWPWASITNIPANLVTGSGTSNYVAIWDSTGTNLVNGAIMSSNGVIYLTDYDADKVLMTSTGGEVIGRNMEWPWSSITNAPSIPGTNGFIQGIGTLNRVSKFTGTNSIGDSSIIESNGIVYLTGYDADKILQTSTGGEIVGRNIEWPWASITNPPTIPSGDGDLIDGTNILMNTTGSLADRLFGSGDITVNVIGNGDLIAGTGVTLGGTLTDRLLGNGDVTINSTGGITGSGTETYIPIWNGATSLGDGPMSYDGSTLTFSPSVQNQFGSLGWIKGLRANLDGGPGSANNSYLGGSEIPFNILYVNTVRSDSIVNTNSIQSGDYKDHAGNSGADGTNNIATVGDGLVTTLGTTANLVAGTGITFTGDPTNRIVGSGNLTINATTTTQTTFGMMILTNKQSVILESTNAYTYQGSKITLNSDTAILKVYGTNDPDRCAIQEITGGVDGRILIIMNSIFEGQPLHIIVGCTNATSTNNVIALSPSEVLSDPYDQRFSPGYNKANPTLIYDGDANKWILMDKSTGI